MHKKEDSVRQPDHPVVNPPKWLKKLAMILTSVLLLTIFGLGGYWLGARQQQSSSTSLFTKPIPSWPSTTTSIRQRSLTPTKVNNKATSNSNWKTFTFEDKRLGYSLRYPANMYLKQVGDFPVIISNFQGDVPPDQKYNKGNLLISIVDFNFKEASVGDYLDAWWVDYKRDGIPPVPPRALGTIMIGDIQAVKTVNPIATHLGGKVINYFFTREVETPRKDGYVFKHRVLYEIDLKYGSGEENPELRAVFDQILSTFKFIH